MPPSIQPKPTRRWRFGSVASLLATLMATGPQVSAAPKVVELSHRAQVKRVGATAHIKVEREFVVQGGNQHDSFLSFDLPNSAGLRKLRVRANQTWLRASLIGASKARARFDSLQTKTKPKPGIFPALGLMTRSGHGAYLRFPFWPQHQRVRVAYEVVTPLCYAHGQYHFGYPHRAELNEFEDDHESETLGYQRAVIQVRHGARPMLRRSVARGAFDQSGCSEWMNHEPSYVIADNARAKPRPQLRLSIRAASVSAGKQHLQRVEIEAGKRLANPPVAASVVFVLDGSLSTSDFDLRDQITMMKAIAPQFPRGKFEVVVFRRNAERLFQGFVSAKQLAARLSKVAAAKLRLGNGSRVDRGLALAEETLQKRRGSTRVIAFTDGEMSQALIRGGLNNSSPPGALINVARFSSKHSPRPLSEQNLNDAMFAPFARQTGGTALALRGSVDDTSRLATTLAHLVAPIRVDDFSVTVGGKTVNVGSYGQRARTLWAGEGIGVTRLIAEPGPVIISGHTWGRKFRKVAKTTLALKRDLPALAVADDSYRFLEAKERASFARNAGVLSEEQSFLVSSGRSVPVGNGEGVRSAVLSSS